MKSTRPPWLASWLFKCILPDERYEALAGDLIEEYIRKGSDLWYWHQVLGAIGVRCWSELRSRWPTVVFAAFLSTALPWKHSWFQSVLFWGIKLPWPTSLITGIASLTAFEGVVVLAAQLLHSVARRNFDVRRMVARFALALLTLSFANLAIPLLFLLSRFGHSRVLWHLPLFLALLVAMWATPPRLGHAATSATA